MNNVRTVVGPLALLAALAILAHLLAARREAWQVGLARLGDWTPAPYLLLWLVLVPCGLPAATLGLTAGFLFGAVAGTAWASLGLFASGLAMHGLGRRWLRPRLSPLLATHPRLARIGQAAATGGARFHLLARLSPLNYALVSYTLAAGGAPLRPYLAGLAGGLPGLVAYVWLGAAAAGGARAGAGDGDAARLVVTALGGASLLGLALWLARDRGRGDGA